MMEEGGLLVATGAEAFYITSGPSSDVFWTVVSGVLVFVIGQIFLETILKPKMEYEELRAKIASDLILYANLYTNPMTTEDSIRMPDAKKEYDAASSELRKLASEFVGFRTKKFRIICSIDDDTMSKVASELIGLSNGFFASEKGWDKTAEQNSRMEKNIKEYLRIS